MKYTDRQNGDRPNDRKDETPEGPPTPQRPDWRSMPPGEPATMHYALLEISDRTDVAASQATKAAQLSQECSLESATATAAAIGAANAALAVEQELGKLKKRFDQFDGSMKATVRSRIDYWGESLETKFGGLLGEHAQLIGRVNRIESVAKSAEAKADVALDRNISEINVNLPPPAPAPVQTKSSISASLAAVPKSMRKFMSHHRMMFWFLVVLAVAVSAATKAYLSDAR